MTSTLSPLLAAYVKAANAHDTDALVAYFTSDAIVHDEGAEIKGTAAIREWKDATNAKYRVTLEVTDVEEKGDKTIMTALVSGTFDGSPITLRYHFTIRDDKIAELSITA
jgi:ketosteroid isomerase-like protein